MPGDPAVCTPGHHRGQVTELNPPPADVADLLIQMTRHFVRGVVVAFSREVAGQIQVRNHIRASHWE